METGKLLILIGSGIVVAGLVFRYAPWLINWFGNLPGDINLKDTNYSVYIPITSMLVISLILTLIVNLFFRK